MLWGEPVKPGQHHAGSLDLKGRGRKPVDLQFFKDLDDELEETETQPSRTNRQRKERNFGPFVTSKDTQQNGNEEDDDDDFESIPKRKPTRTKLKEITEEELPDLLIEESNSNDSVEAKKLNNEGGNTQKTVLSQENKLETGSESVASTSGSHVNYRKEGNSVIHLNDLNKTAASDESDKINKVEPKKGTNICSIPLIVKSSSGRLSRSNKKGKKETVLVQETQTMDGEIEADSGVERLKGVVAETQDDFDEEELRLAIKRSREDQGRSQGDTIDDDDVEFLEVHANSDGQSLEILCIRQSCLVITFQRRQLVLTTVLKI